MKVAVDKNLCIGCALCASTCVDTFEMDNNNLAYVKQQPSDTMPSEDCVLAAATECPTDAIEVRS